MNPARHSWQRRYPPLLLIAAAVALAIYTLPSALNLPQANPGQLAEYAPLLGHSSAEPPGGNFAGLGLGAGAGTGGGDLGAAGGGPPGAGLSSNYDCVGNPPRQTEDLLSPPCVPYFNGDNGGATWGGVTGKTITVLFRMTMPNSAEEVGDSHQNVAGPPTGYYDMDNPADVGQYFEFDYLHAWEVYFNRRYQTYHRRVHFWVYNYDTGEFGTYDTSSAAADASDNWHRLHPFAVIQNVNFDANGDYPAEYGQLMAERGVLSFGSYGFTQSLASQYPGLFWAFPPSLDRQAQEYASFVCSRIVKPGRVTFSGNGDGGAPRVYGLLLTDDASKTATQEQQKLSVHYLQQDCGMTFRDTETFHISGCICIGSNSGWGPANMARMKAKGVTTIIWPGGVEAEDMQAASAERWHPEWVLEGDDSLDQDSQAGLLQSDEMAHAWITTREPRMTNQWGVEDACAQAILEVDPGINRTTADIANACVYYDDIRQLFTGIQLAGPHVRPSAMDSGFHAIPPKPSASPSYPSCFYLVGDYTCVKDAAAEWWDPAAHIQANESGCWRMWEGGRRYLAGQWPDGDATSGANSNDPCNYYGVL